MQLSGVASTWKLFRWLARASRWGVKGEGMSSSISLRGVACSHTGCEHQG